MSNGTQTELRRRAVIGGMWTVLQKVYENLAVAIGLIALARLVDTQDFGLVSLAAVFVAITTLLADLGVTPGLIRAESVSARRLSTAFWLGISLSTTLCLVIELAAPVIASWLNQPELTPVLRVLALAVPLNAFCAVPTALLTRALQMKPLAVRRILASTVGTAGAVTIAALGGGVWALVFQQCGTIVIDIAVLWRAVNWRPTREFDLAEAKGLLRFGATVTITQLVHQGRDRAVELLIGRLLGAPALGVWVIATRISQLIQSMFASVVNTVALPTFAKLAHDRDLLAAAYRHAIRTCGTAALPGLLAVAAVSPVAVPFLFGAKWDDSGPIAQLTAISAALVSVQWLDSNVWWAVGKPKIEFRLTLLISVAHVALVWIFAGHGLLPIAIALLVRTVVSVPLRAFFLVRYGNIPVSVFRDMPRLVVCTGLMYAAMAGLLPELRSLPDATILGIEAVVMLVIYLGSSWLVQRAALLEVVGDLRRIRGPKEIVQEAVAAA